MPFLAIAVLLLRENQFGVDFLWSLSLPSVVYWE